jgi:hypothetical protein
MNELERWSAAPVSDKCRHFFSQSALTEGAERRGLEQFLRLLILKRAS